MVAAIFLLLMSGVIVAEIVYELRTSTLIGRGWKVYAHRDDDPQLYWSSVVIEIILALTLVGVSILAILGRNAPGAF